ncbi:hypothetical protein niasHT_039058 [Heterodera trifolii]|uniref:Uncharacterized protein n=1 Tax=Heterodera trifolii TaxID=157864 RepID=A0ABD2IAF2_9BILA
MPNIQQQKKHEMVDSNDESNEDGSIIKAEPSPLTDQSATSLMTHNSSNAEEGGHIISSNGGAQICGGDGTVPLTSRWSPCSASSAGNPLLWYETDKCPYCNQKCRKPRRLLDCLHFVCEECVPEQCLLLDNLDPDEIRCPNCSQVEMSSISDQSTESSRVEICSKHKEKLTLFCLSCARLLCVNCEQQLSLPTAQVNTVTNVVAVPQLSASKSNSGALRMKFKRTYSASSVDSALPTKRANEGIQVQTHALANLSRQSSLTDSTTALSASKSTAVSMPNEFSATKMHIEELVARGVNTWTVEEVSSWANFVTGSDKIGDRFAEEEVDGASLLCLEYEELKTELKLKLGPSKNIWSNLEALKKKR